MTNPPEENGDPNVEPDPFAETQFGQTPNLKKEPTQPDPQQPDPQFGQTPQFGDGAQPAQDPFGQPQPGQPQYGAAPGYPGGGYPGNPYPANPYPAGPAGASGPAPANSMVSAIVLTVLGFLATCVTCLSLVAGIIGIVAIVKANAVNGQWQRGDAAGAQRSADDAKKWSNIGWIVFAVAIVLWVIGLIVLAATGNSAGYYDFSS